MQPAPGARSKEKFVSLPDELEELELPPPLLEVPPALFEVGRISAKHCHVMVILKSVSWLHMSDSLCSASCASRHGHYQENLTFLKLKFSMLCMTLRSPRGPHGV